MAKQSSGLGRGLDALFGDAALRSTSPEGSLLIPLAQIEPGLNQPRKHFDDETLEELADSIRTHGIIQPLTVRRLQSGYYQIIAGERRWRAAKLAEISELPVVVIEADDRKVMELGLIENLQREDLNPMEEAAGYFYLMQEFGLTQEAVSEQVGKSRPTVANALRLLQLPPSIQPLVEDGSLSSGHAKAILSLPTAQQQEQLADLIVREGLSVRQTEKLARSGLFKKEEADEPEEQPLQKDDPRIYIAALEQDLGKQFGRKVHIKAGKRKGRIELEYYDSEDLENLLSLLRGGNNA